MADYIEVTDLGLIPATTYYYKFQWKYADGTTSEFSAVKSLTTAGDLKAQAPTLATGFTADKAPFGVTIFWDGTYASSAFTGFKSVNIYASTTNLGSSTTTNLTANLVGSMTVDQQKNKITIGSTLLKNTLSLTSTTVYTTPIYFYFITVNSNNEVYKSGGVATYTRINSTGIIPAQANIIDLENGTISIENLVAGNGQFTEYMRIGTSPGARIELGADSVVTTGAGVTPGLTIYDSGNNAVLSAPLSGGLTIKGDLVTSSFSNVSSGTGISISRTTNLNQIVFNSSSSVAATISVGTDYLGSSGIQINYGSSGTNAGFVAVDGAAAIHSGISGSNIKGLIIDSSGDGTFYRDVIIKDFLYAQSFPSNASPQTKNGAIVGGIRNIYSGTSLASASSYGEGDIFVVY